MNVGKLNLDEKVNPYLTRKDERKAEAAERQAEREKRGDAGQLKKLEREGHSHCKEAKRLRVKLGIEEGE
jgi:hypothetical protein